MKSRKTPQQKKTESYRKDRVVVAEYPHAKRKTKPRRKKRANGELRHRIKQTLDSERLRGEYLDGTAAEAFRRRSDVYSITCALGECVEFRQRARIFRVGDNFFRHAYDSKRDRERFIRFLTALTTGRTGQSKELAAHFAVYLQPPEVLPDKHLARRHIPQRHRWLNAFFVDEPSWRDRLMRWIRSLSATDR